VTVIMLVLETTGDFLGDDRCDGRGRDRCHRGAALVRLFFCDVAFSLARSENPQP